MRPVLGGEFPVTFNIDVGLHCAEWNDVAKLWPDAHDPGLETANPVARTTVAADLIVDIANHPDLKLLGQELRRAPIEVHVHASLVLGGGIGGVVGKAEHA